MIVLKEWRMFDLKGKDKERDGEKKRKKYVVKCRLLDNTFALNILTA